MPRTVSALLVCALSLLVLISSAAAADTAWPERPIRLIVPFQPGSSSDVIARIVAVQLGPKLGTQVVVENRVGGSTIVGTELVARAAPDGYTMGLANTSSHAASRALSNNLPFDPIRDFTPVAMIGSSPFILLGSKQVPVSNMKVLIAYAKSNPAKLNYASAGPATLSHLAGELFKKLAGVDITHVPYRGTAQSVIDLLEGRMQLLVGVINSTQDFVRDGRLTAFATLDTRRTRALPNVPTVAEAGVPGAEAVLWTALVLPAGVPEPIVEKLNKAVNDVVNMPEVQTSLKKQGIEPEPADRQVVAERIRVDVAKWSDVIATAKIGKH